MTGRYSDFEELRPLGEATQIPDEKLSRSSDGEPRRQRAGGVDAGYPDDTTATAAECTSCGTSIPTGQTKCRFCLVNHLDAATDDQNTPDSECDILHIVQMLVESRTFYGAVAKGSAAATLLANSDSDSTVDDCQLIYDLDEEPAAQLVDQWPALPSATRVRSESGAQLLGGIVRHLIMRITLTEAPRMVRTSDVADLGFLVRSMAERT